MWKTIRTFGVDRCDLPTIIWNVAVMLRVVAVKVEREADCFHDILSSMMIRSNTRGDRYHLHYGGSTENASGIAMIAWHTSNITPSQAIPTLIYISTIACAVCYIYVFHVSMVWFVFKRAHGDVVAAVKVITLGTTSLIGMTKLIYLYFYQAQVQDMIARYKMYDTLPLAPKTVDLMQYTMKIVKTRAVIFWSFINGNGLAFLLKPLFMSGRNLSSEDQILFGLEPMLETPNYEIAQFCIFTAVSFIIFVVSNITILLIITAGYSEGRALALGQELRHLWQDAEQHYKETFDANYKGNKKDQTAAVEINKYLDQRLRIIFRSHATNINLVKSLEDIFREATAVEFILVSLSLIADLLGDLRNTYIVLPFPLILLSMDCFTGQRLMDASKNFEDAVYDSKWENFDASNRRMVVLMLRLSQKNLSLSAGGVIVLGFSSLMTVITKVYSAYTTLQSTVKQ